MSNSTTPDSRPETKSPSFQDGFSEGATRIAGILVPEGFSDLTVDYLAGVLKAMEPALERVRNEYRQRLNAMSDEESDLHYQRIARWS